jgi:hypothetical protein
MVKSCSGERLKKVYFSPKNKEPSLFAGLSQTAYGGNGNPEESEGIRRNPEESCANTGISVLQEFQRKTHVKAAEKRIFKTPPKPRPCEKFLRKKTENKEILRNPGTNRFLGSKKQIPENRNRQPRLSTLLSSDACSRASSMILLCILLSLSG